MRRSITLLLGSILIIGISQIISIGGSVQTSELEVDFIGNYSLVWTDKGSGATADVSFWRPEPAAGWFRVGHHMKRGHGNPTGQTMVVRGQVNGVLARPVDYFPVWNDTNSGATQDGSVWRPSCPVGFGSLGDVTSGSHAKPTLDEVVCVRQSALGPANIGGEIWNDTGSGAARNFAAWDIPAPAADPNFTFATRGLFFGAASHNRPQAVAMAVRILRTTSGGGSSPGNTSGSSVDQQFWDSIKNSQREQDYQSYLQNFPNGQFAALARLKISQLTPTSVPPPVTASGTSADQQFWDAVKNSQRATDYQSYLQNFPNGQFAALARLKVDQLSPVSTPQQPVIPAGNAADLQFWDAVKNSQRASDYQSYLQNFPNGQFAPLARLKIDQMNQSVPPVTVPSNMSGQDQTFWDAVKNSQRVSDYQSYLQNFPNGQFSALARLRIDQLNQGVGSVQSPTTGVNPADAQFWDAVKNSQRVSDYLSYLQNFPSGQFAALARLKIDQLQNTRPVAPTTSRNAPFLNRLAGENRAKLPITVGDIQLFDAASVCPSGCQQMGNSEALVIRARTPNLARNNVSIGQVERSLKPAMLQGYCGSPEQISNVIFDIDVTDRFNQKIGNFFVTSRDCAGNTGNVGTLVPTAPPTVLPSGRTEAQLIAAAQIGSLSELARFRNYTIAVDNIDAKTKITNAIRKELPQLQTAANPSTSEFFIGVSFTDRKTGADVPYDARNAELSAEFVVFTVTQWVNQSPFNIRIHFRMKKDRSFGVFSDTPEESAAKEFAKQFSRVITP